MKLFLIVVDGQKKNLVYNDSAKSFKAMLPQYSTPLSGGKFVETSDRVYFYGKSPYGKATKDEFAELSKGLEHHFKGKEIIFSGFFRYRDVVYERFCIDYKNFRKRYPTHTANLKFGWQWARQKKKPGDKVG